MRLKRTLLAACLLVLAGTVARAEIKGLVVIVNAQRSLAALDGETLTRIFLGKTTTLADGSRVEPVDQSEESEAYQFFTEKAHQKGANAMKAYWARQIFSGAGAPPRRLTSDAEIIDYVAKNPDTIGYVQEGATLKGVKAVEIDGKTVIR